MRLLILVLGAIYSFNLSAEVPNHILLTGQELGSYIAANTYHFQPTAINTASVSALLITRDYGLDTPQCDYVGRIAHAIVKNLHKLKSEGHQKWRSVTFDLKALQQYPNVSPCALQAFGQLPALPEDANNVMTINVSEEIAKGKSAHVLDEKPDREETPSPSSKQLHRWNRNPITNCIAGKPCWQSVRTITLM